MVGRRFDTATCSFGPFRLLQKRAWDSLSEDKRRAMHLVIPNLFPGVQYRVSTTGNEFERWWVDIITPRAYEV